MSCWHQANLKKSSNQNCQIHLIFQWVTDMQTISIIWKIMGLLECNSSMQITDVKKKQ